MNHITKTWVITPQDRYMAREFRKLGPAFISPEWADGGDFEAALEHRADQIMDDDDQALEPLIQDAIEQPIVRESLASIFNAIDSHRCGRLSTDQAKNRAWTAALCLFDELRDQARVKARQELAP